jgi:hypothetical protein
MVSQMGSVDKMLIITLNLVHNLGDNLGIKNEFLNYLF